MQKINFQNLPNISTPLNATNMNAIQTNVENVFNGDVPMGDIKVNSIRTKNMIGSYFIGGIDSTTGEDSSTYSSRRTDYIEVDFSANSNYYISGLPLHCAKFVAAYNSSKQFLGRTGALNNTSTQTNVSLGSSSFTGGTPSGTGAIKYLKVTFYNAASGYEVETLLNSAKVQLEEGSSATTFSEYKGLGYVSGQNANGNYIKYDDGTLMCWNRIKYSTAVNITTAVGNMYRSGNITPFPDYPVSPVGDYSLSLQELSDDNSRHMWIVKTQASGASNVRGICLYAPTSLSNVTNIVLSYQLTGRWK